LVAALAGPVFDCAMAATEAGQAVLSRGAATAQLAGDSARLLGPGATIYEGDVVTTSKRSVAVLELADGTKVTLRPESKFQVESFDTTTNRESSVMRLFRGGMRTVTGFISKRNPNAMQLRTAVATIGIRGTEFDARLCGADCAEEAKRRPAPSGRAGFVRGSVVARTAGGRARNLKAGDGVYVGESIVTGPDSFAVLAFRDQSRVTVLPETEFQVERLDFDAAEPEKGRGVFSLVRGGLRAVSGLIGQENRRNYAMKTPVATIGIRGTGYDLMCQGTCVTPTGPQNPTGDGLFAEVWDGTIDFDGQYPTSTGQTVFLGNVASTPLAVPAMPVPITVPKPNEITIPDTPPPASSTAPEEGLYVSCYVGNCAVETPQNVVELEGGEASFVGTEGGPAEQLVEIPPFQAEDQVTRAVEVGDALNLLNESLESGSIKCTVH
jgi:hypothetical protein